MIPMRPELAAVADVTEDDYTLREALDWFDRVSIIADQLEILGEPEIEYLGKQWAVVVSRTVKGDKLPQGPLAQFLASVAFIEKANEIAADGAE